jgi:hypothetical protein
MNHLSESNPPISLWPLLLAAGLALLVSGVVSSLIVSLVGVIVLLVALIGWVQESRLFGQEEENEDEATHE